jgi:hypothetical protein
MRYSIWKFACRSVPEGTILPNWLIALRAMLFPLDLFYWKMSKSRGYDFRTDTWVIHGIRFSGSAMMSIAKAEGQVFKITRTGETLTFERILSD